MRRFRNVGHRAMVTLSQQPLTAQPACAPNEATLFAGHKCEIDEKLMTPICFTRLYLDLRDKTNEAKHKLHPSLLG